MTRQSPRGVFERTERFCVVRRIAKCAACLICAVAFLPGTAEAVTILLESGETVRGLIVQETAVTILMDELDAKGNKRRRRISMEDVAGIRRPVSNDRLALLKPEQPNEYRLYAEELAEKHADPEARMMALRLYLIAAYLSPADLGRACLLGMASIAQSPAEEKRYRGMAYLLDKGHDPRLLKNAEGMRKLDTASPDTLHVVRLLRTGERSDAFKLIERDAQVANEIERLLPKEHAKAVLSRVCVHCEKGYVPCERCRGTAKTATGENCPACRISRTKSRGKTRCRTCAGKYSAPELTKAQLVSLVKAELQLSGGKSWGVAPTSQWRHEFAEDPVARALDLHTITPFDPTLSVFRNSRWVAP